MVGTSFVNFHQNTDHGARHSHTRCLGSMRTLPRPGKSSICFFALVVQFISFFRCNERSSHLQVESTDHRLFDMIQDSGPSPKLFQTDEATSGRDKTSDGILDSMRFELIDKYIYIYIYMYVSVCQV